MKQLSRQRLWQLRKIAEGKCSICGEPREPDKGGSAQHCPRHHIADLVASRTLRAKRKGKAVPVEPKHSLEQLVELRNRRAKNKANGSGEQ